MGNPDTDEPGKEPGRKMSGLKLGAELSSTVSGRRLEVWTDQPGVQVYTGNWLEGSPVSKSGRSYHDYDGVAIECQDLPDSPNHPAFPSTELRPRPSRPRNFAPARRGTAPFSSSSQLTDRRRIHVPAFSSSAGTSLLNCPPTEPHHLLTPQILPAAVPKLML